MELRGYLLLFGEGLQHAVKHVVLEKLLDIVVRPQWVDRARNSDAN